MINKIKIGIEHIKNNDTGRKLCREKKGLVCYVSSEEEFVTQVMLFMTETLKRLCPHCLNRIRFHG